MLYVNVSLLTKPINQLSDLELEETIHLLDMDVRWSRNLAYAVSGARSQRLMRNVKLKEGLLRNLGAERERRIAQGGYHPFT
jgi:hypothetical protein